MPRFNIIAILFIAVTFLVPFGSVSLGASKFSVEKLREAYLLAAFPDKTSTLTKWISANRVRLKINCSERVSKNCQSIPLYMDAALLDRSNLILEQAEFGDFFVDFSRIELLPSRREALTAAYLNGIRDSEDLDCQLYMRVESSRIINAALVISGDSTPQKIVSCLVYSFYRTQGLSQLSHKSFAESWSKSSIATELTIEQVAKSDELTNLKEAIAALVYIHSCALLTSGMSIQDARRVLERDNSCVEKLIGGVQ